MQQLPFYANIDEVRAAAELCTACDRAETRQQVVFGAGNPDACLMLVGEAPSGTDDSTGKPFTGPAGKLLDELLGEAGVERDEIWITNLVRCFAGRVRDGRPENRPVRAGEVSACRQWLDLEIQYVNPRVIVAVGAPAAHALISRDVKLTEERGRFFTRPDGRLAMATIQPAYVMRLRNLVDQAAYDTAREQLAADLKVAIAEANRL